MLTANHPGVYVQEISTLPPSIAPVATAIPVFIGYTEKSPPNSPTPVRIETMLDYVTIFGGPCKKGFTVTVDENSPTGPSPALTVNKSEGDVSDNFLMYYGLSLYFQNGGGSCYILSVGKYYDTNSIPSDKVQPYKDALDALEKEDEPTLIVLLDATTLGTIDYYDLCSQARNQCNVLGDRFLIVDILDDDAKAFRNSSTFGSNYLSYAAAYYPYVNTTINYAYDENSVIVNVNANVANFIWSPVPAYIFVAYSGTVNDEPKVSISQGDSLKFDTTIPGTLTITISSTQQPSALDFVTTWKTLIKSKKLDPKGFDIYLNPFLEKSTVQITSSQKLINVTYPVAFTGITDNDGFAISYIGQATESPQVTFAASVENGNCEFDTSTQSTLKIKIPGNEILVSDLVKAWGNQKNNTNPNGFDINIYGKGISKISSTTPSITLLKIGTTLGILKNSNTALYNQIKTQLVTRHVTLPPSPAIAGVYASVDRDRGVWKAPANVSLNSVIGPATKISDADQDDLNIDPTAGKSINAIRSFTGKGTLVWGARTLAGNDNEWRYVPVRRLFIFIEESTRKATAFAVFEPNDATTWLKVKAMIESFLYGLWQQGALAGSKPDQAYFVSVGLGKTMTPQDILEGRMIVTIGVAAVRPAEFIILTFSHKMQEA
jgi:uncharacterized protein